MVCIWQNRTKTVQGSINILQINSTSLQTDNVSLVIGVAFKHNYNTNNNYNKNDEFGAEETTTAASPRNE